MFFLMAPAIDELMRSHVEYFEAASVPYCHVGSVTRCHKSREESVVLNEDNFLRITS